MRSSCLAVSKNLINLSRKCSFQKKISKGTKEYSLFSCICFTNDLFASYEKPEKTIMFILHFLVSGIVLPFFFPFNMRSPPISWHRFMAIERLLRGLWSITFTKSPYLRVIWISDDFSAKRWLPHRGPRVAALQDLPWALYTLPHLILTLDHAFHILGMCMCTCTKIRITGCLGGSVN